MKIPLLAKRFAIYIVGGFVLLMMTSSGSFLERFGIVKGKISPLVDWGMELPGQVADAFVPAAAASTSGPEGSRIKVAFSPGGAENLILSTIRKASKTIYLAGYSFTSRHVANALLAAAERGIEVMVVLDSGQETATYSKSRYLARKGLPLRLNDNYSIMHNKFMVVDGDTVQTGSYNYTASANTRNAENVIVVENHPELAAIYKKEWLRLWNESTPYQGNR